jgi:4,5-DOPA dioxygenase extradiol
MPVVFFGHGSPMNAISSNEWTGSWARFGRTAPHPRAILTVSAHWFTAGIGVTAMERPRTIHDFGGFPRELFAMQYPALGDPALAARVRDLLKPTLVVMDEEWGFDHGTWSVLCHAYPDADIPVVQLSMDATKPAAFHHDLAARLAPLRDEGVLIVGSGNLVHNLHTYAWGRHAQEPFDWALRFEAWARERMTASDDAALVAYEAAGEDAMLSVPKPEHYLPLLYVLALRRNGEAPVFITEGMDGGSVSMLSVAFGMPA